MKKYKEILIVIVSFLFMSVCIFTGFIVADKNTRRVCFGDNSPVLNSNFNIKDGEVEIKVSVFGEIHRISINLYEYIEGVFDKFNSSKNILG